MIEDVSRDRESWLQDMEPWTSLAPTVDPWWILTDLHLWSPEEDAPTDLAVFLLQEIQMVIELPLGPVENPCGEIPLTSSDLDLSLFSLLVQLREDPTIGPVVADVVARRLIRHGVPANPIYLCKREEGLWYVSIEPAGDTPWGQNLLSEEEQKKLARVLRLGGILNVNSFKESGVKLRSTGSKDETKSITGGYWPAPASDVYGWLFELP